MSNYSTCLGRVILYTYVKLFSKLMIELFSMLCRVIQYAYVNYNSSTKIHPLKILSIYFFSSTNSLWQMSNALSFKNTLRLRNVVSWILNV